MRRITVDEMIKLEGINGKLETRLEYITAIKNILDANLVACRFNKNHMTTISLDKTTIMEITTKTIKGRRYVVGLNIDDLSKEHRSGLYLERDNKTGKWLTAYDSVWFNEVGNYTEGAKKLVNSEYVG